MSASVGTGSPEPLPRPGARLAPWWPLIAITLAAAALRLSTLGLQSFWYDEAFTSVHVLHTSLGATLRAVTRTENSPPLWYLIEWLDFRVLGRGEVALRLPSALAGIATVPLAWAIGRELAGRRAAIVCAGLLAVDPLFVWYSQEARVYGLFVAAAALLTLCFLRAERDPTPLRMAAFALSGALALGSHYFAVFLLVPMVAWLLGRRRLRRAAAPAAAALLLVGLSLLPLISRQGGHGTQWIGRWPLGERLQAIVQYYLTGNSGAPLGHGVELLIALPLLLGAGLGLARLLERPRPAGPAPAAGPRSPREGARLAALIAAGGVLIPVGLAVLGADYLAPRNLVGAMIPLSGLLAVLIAARRDTVGLAIAVTGVIALLAISIDVDLSPRLQRGNWRGLAAELTPAAGGTAITTVELGAAPLEYYLPGLHHLAAGRTVTLTEIDETGYSPLRASAGRPPAPGFTLYSRVDVDGLIALRFRSAVPRRVSEAVLRRHVITLARPEVLVPGATRAAP